MCVGSLKKLIRNPRRMEGPHTHTHIPYCFHKETNKESKEEGGKREGAHTHAFPIVFIRKLIGNPRRREGAPNFPYCSPPPTFLIDLVMKH